MAPFSKLFVSLLLATAVVVAIANSRRYPTPKTKAVPKPKPVKLNTDGLPVLQDILQSLGLTRFLKDFIRMGVTETRLLIRLTSMDFRLMSIEWDGITDEEILKLKEEVASLYMRAIVAEEPVKPELGERNKLTYGRMYLADSVQNFEYIQASFGGPPPIGPSKLVKSTSIYGCDENDSIDYTGITLLALRGNCTFLKKAQNAKKQNATALVIVNTEDILESASSGLGVDKNITDAMVLALGDFAVISVANTSWAKLNYALEFNAAGSTFINIVPLKCRSGGVCAPLLEEEKALQSEVTWGSMRTRDSNTLEVRSFEFLTSNFGCQLPTQSPVKMVLADPIDACSALVSPLGSNNTPFVDYYKGAAVVVHRGGCRFDTKALAIQDVGARMVIVVDVDDNALQRIGGMAPQSGFVGIPSIIINAPNGAYIREVLTRQANSTNSSEPILANMLTAELIPSRNSEGSDRWIELAFTNWSEDDGDRLVQLEGLIQKYVQSQSSEIVAWLTRRMKEITDPLKPVIQTDHSEEL